MSKERQALEKLFDILLYSNNKIEAQKYYDAIKQALKRLEAIDNANPSEALECLDRIGDIELSHTETCCNETKDDEYIETLVEVIDGILKDKYKKEYNTIKQALLKAQEQKKYLKWEDLEFKEKTSQIEVKLNKTLYTLSYVKRQYLDFVYLINNDSQIRLNSANDKQFFNDLHLEVVE